MTFLSKGLRWHSRQLANAAGVAIVYRRGNHRFTIPDAVKAKTAFEVDGEDGRLVKSYQVDFIVRRDTLLINDKPIEPVEGDRISLGDELYEVQLGGDLERCFREHGSESYRIHVRLVKET